MYFPFLTTHWKSQKNFQSHFQAREEGALTGATIVNYLHEFFVKAGNFDPTYVETCHFSITCDLETVQLYIHWRNDMTPASEFAVEYHMEPIAVAFLRDIDQMTSMRKIIKNIFEYAIIERLDNIRDAISSLMDKQEREEIDQYHTANLCPPTPSPLTSEKPRKRKRVASFSTSNTLRPFRP